MTCVAFFVQDAKDPNSYDRGEILAREIESEAVLNWKQHTYVAESLDISPRFNAEKIIRSK